MTIDIDVLLKLASFFLSVAAILWTFVATRQKDNDEKFKAGSDRMDRLDKRIVTLEQAVKDMPGKEDLHAVQIELTRMNGTMEAVKAVMDGNQKIMSRLENIVSRHEDHLLSEGRK